MTDSIDDYVNIILDDFLDRKRLREKIQWAHLNKADDALKKCIYHISKAADTEQIKLYRLLCYLGSRIEEISKDRNVITKKYPNWYWWQLKKTK